MQLKKVKASKVNLVLKANVHKTGRLGFSSDAAEFMGLEEGYSAEILMNEEDSNDKNLYVKIHNNQEDADNFKIGKAGDYFYIGMKWFFKNNNEDYVSEEISYDIMKTEINGELYYLFKRIKSKKTIRLFDGDEEV